LIFLILSVFGTVFGADNTTELVSVDNSSIQGNQASSDAVISADGRFVAFSSNADNLVAGDTNGYWDVFVRDRFLNITERVSISTSGQEGNHHSKEPSISADGRYVVFTSFASNLVEGGVPSGQPQLYVRDRFLGTTELVSISPDGNPGDGWSQSGSINANGRFVTFISSSTNLMASATDGKCEVFVRDLVLNISERVSISNDGSISGGCGWPPSISGDGRFVAFVSWAPLDCVDDLWANLFVHDRQLKTTTRIAQQFHWDEGMSYIYQTSLSGDGRYLAFVNRPSIIYGRPDFDDPNFWNYFNPNIFVLDRASGNIKMVSVSDSGEWSNYESMEPSISSDGRYLVFTSYANNLVVGDDNDAPDIFICDLQSSTIQRVFDSPSIYEGLDFNPSLSDAGNYLVFNFNADNLVVGDSNGNTDVFIHTFKENISIHGHLNHELVRSGDSLRINAASNMDTLMATVFINGVEYNLVKQPDNWWVLDYTVPYLHDGGYSITLTAFDGAGNSGTSSLNFTVDNTPPTLYGNINPNLLRSGDSLTLQVSSDPDTSSITALIQGVTYSLTKQANGTWKLIYKVPSLDDGDYPIQLTATDNAGNQGTNTLTFTVDNTPPTPTGTAAPNLVKLGSNIVLRILSSLDTAKVTAHINGTILNLVKQSDGSWRSEYAVPLLPDGPQSVLLNAFDNAGNTGSATLTFTVDNTPPKLNGNITPEQVVAGKKLKITVNSSNDTSRVTATIHDQTIDLILVGGLWTTSYTIPLNTTPGWDIITLEALDVVGNQGQAYAYYMVVAAENNTNSNETQNTTVISSAFNDNEGLIQLEQNGSTGQSGVTSGTSSSNGVTSDNSSINVLDQVDNLLNGLGFGKIVSGDPPFYGPLTPILKASWNPLSNFFQYLEDHYNANGVKSPINDPIGFFSYIPDKFGDAWEKYQQTGNIWDFFNYPYIHIYGFSNLDNTFGGQNIKTILELLCGVDPNTGDLSIGNFLLLIISLIPIGRLGISASKILAKSPTLLKIWGIVDQPLTLTLNKLGIFSKNPMEIITGISSKIGSFIDAGLGTIPALFEILAGLSRNTLLKKIVGNPIYQQVLRFDTIRSVTIVSNPNNWTLNNVSTSWNNFISGSAKNVEWAFTTTINAAKAAANVAKNIGKQVANTVKVVSKQVVKTVQKVVKKTVKVVTKTYKKVVKVVKKVYRKVVRVVNKVVNIGKGIVNSVVNWGKSIGKALRLW